MIKVYFLYHREIWVGKEIRPSFWGPGIIHLWLHSPLSPLASRDQNPIREFSKSQARKWCTPHPPHIIGQIQSPDIPYCKEGWEIGIAMMLVSSSSYVLQVSPWAKPLLSLLAILWVSVTLMSFHPSSIQPTMQGFWKDRLKVEWKHLSHSPAQWRVPMSFSSMWPCQVVLKMNHTLHSHESQCLMLTSVCHH
jgi:hypothetical protein